MAGCCNDDACTVAPPRDDRRWRAVLWVALVINAGMFAVEVGAGLATGSRALQADSLDFLGDAANYAISLGVAGLALRWRARAALLKGGSLAGVGLWVFATTLWAVFVGATPRADVMGLVGAAALAANAGVALMLFSFRKGDANRRSVWICSRNDAIGNLAVLAAAAGVFGTGARWPDLIVAAIMAALSIWGGWQIVSQAAGELNSDSVQTAPAE